MVDVNLMALVSFRKDVPQWKIIDIKFGWIFKKAFMLKLCTVISMNMLCSAFCEIQSAVCCRRIAAIYCEQLNTSTINIDSDAMLNA